MQKVEPPTDVPDEFKGAIRLARFHRYAIAVDDVEVTAYFGLVGEDGSHNYYKCDTGTLSSIGFNIGSLGVQAKELEAGNGLISQPVPFETGVAFVGLMSGGDADGHLLFHFGTLSGTGLMTRIKPEVAAMFAGSLKEALASLPTPPDDQPFGIVGGNLSGKEHDGQTFEHFGQKFRKDIIQALGVLMIRANLLDQNLIKLSAALSGMRIE